MNTISSHNYICQNTVFCNKNTANLNDVNHNNQNPAFDSKTDTISITEGAKLFGTGFSERIKNLFEIYKKQPLMLLTRAGITALPFLAGKMLKIPNKVTAGILTLGCSIVSIHNAIIHTKQALQHSKENKEILKDDIKQLGADSLDLAFSLPFLPHSLKGFKKGVSPLSTGGIMLETLKNSVPVSSLIKAFEHYDFLYAVKMLNIDNKSKEKLLELENVNYEDFIKKSYEIITDGVGLDKAKPELKIINDEDMPGSGGECGVDKETGDDFIKFNSACIKNYSKASLVNIVRHEVRHAEQELALYTHHDPFTMIQALAMQDGTYRSEKACKKYREAYGIREQSKENDEYVKKLLEGMKYYTNKEEQKVLTNKSNKEDKEIKKDIEEKYMKNFAEQDAFETWHTILNDYFKMKSH